MRLRVLDSLDRVPREDWNRLAGTANPFTRHEFLAALEHHGCVGEGFGWWPRHLVVEDDQGALVGACPLYVKDNSYGEFVFDWAWADAYQRAGLRYYPKLVCAVPYTPVTGPRLLVDPDTDAAAVRRLLVQGAVELAEAGGASSVHWLFTDAAETAAVEALGPMRRVGVQYHWHNRGYRDFHDFLETLTARRRKEIRRERRLAAETGAEVEVLDGHSATDAHWDRYTRFYQSTFDRKWGVATLNEGFFREVAATLPDQVVLVMTRHQGEYVSGAFNLAGADALYGRHWGESRHLPHVHFEVCYYRTIDWCIERGLARFEAGAQGEHKIPRGFLPQATWSTHHIRDPRFRDLIGRFLEHEREEMAEVIADLAARSPYREEN